MKERTEEPFIAWANAYNLHLSVAWKQSSTVFHYS
jgi:hypothetical protein